MVTMELDNFSLEQICDSGQCFRMKKTGEYTYSLVAGNQYLEISQKGSIVDFNCSDTELICFWVPYFDLDADYSAYIEKVNPRDKYLSTAAAHGSGIRILQQDLWEMIVTFLISQLLFCSLCQNLGSRKAIIFHSVSGNPFFSVSGAQPFNTAPDP